MKDHPAASNRTPERDIAYHLHSQSNPTEHKKYGPVVISHGKGAKIWDTSGREYIDGMAGLWCAALGFGNERLSEVMFEASKKIGFYHTFFSRSSDQVAELAEKLSQMSMIEDGRVFFATSGSEANETMVKLAWVYHTVRGNPGKRKVIARDRAFHGSTIAAASMCGLETMHREFALPIPGYLHLTCPYPFRKQHDGESEAEFTARLAAEFEEMILREGPDTIAAFIAEPVMAGGGVIVPPKGYFPAIRALCDKYDILMLDDEIVNGFGRTGEWFGRVTTDMQPDMMSLAKNLTSSYFPMSAVVMRPEIFDAVETFNKEGGFFGHGFTNSGHPVGAAVALECIRMYEELDIVTKVRASGQQLRNRLNDLAQDSPVVGEVRGEGLMFGVELVRDRATKEPFPAGMSAGFAFDALALEEGLVIRAMGDTIVLSPPLIIDADTVDDIATRFGKALRRFETSL